MMRSGEMWWKRLTRGARTGRNGALIAALGAAALLSACAGSAGGTHAGATTTSAAGTPERVQAIVTSSPTLGAVAGASTTTPIATATPSAGQGKGGKYAGLLPQLDARQIYAALQRAQLPVSDGTAVTAANDPDGKLGTPGGYTSRVDFLDTSLAQPGTAWSLANCGAIEV